MRKWTNCQGTGIGPRGEKYVGEFYKGNFPGQGTFTKAGRKLIGEWQDGKRHGNGIFTYSDGKIEKGIWRKNKLVRLK